MQVATSHDIRIYKDRWPKGAVVYQIYPRSWQDSNGDGIGDLPGITSRLPYLHELGVNAIWLSPFYPSPMADFGYDISDYCDVDPIYGTLEDFRELLTTAHDLHIKIIIDLVPNHTSDKHPWFDQSRLSRTNRYADWYVWHDGKPNPNGGQPLVPNNWLNALTSTSAWEWEEARQQYYLHSFHVRQPDLNWENPAVAEAMLEVMRFWLDIGVDGFRVDAVYFMSKNPDFLDDILTDPASVEHHPPRNSLGWPKVYQHLSKMAAVLKEASKDGNRRFMVTEAYPYGQNSLNAYMKFYDGVDSSVAAPFNFDGLMLPWQAATWHTALDEFHKALAERSTHTIASYAFGNHDKWRVASRLGDARARAAAVMQLTLPGMTFIYYGEEIGMQNAYIPPELVKDPATQPEGPDSGNRDAERTPMQWSATHAAGFSNTDKTWLPVAASHTIRNVDIERQDPHSYLNLYKRLCAIRNENDVIAYGNIDVLPLEASHILAYLRTLDKQRMLTVINFSDQKLVFQPPVELHTCLVSSDPQSALPAGPASPTEIELLPYEAALFSVK